MTTDEREAKEEETPQRVPTPGGPVSLEDKALERGASIIQDFTPLKQICAHLNGFRTYASEPGRAVESNHYCAHLTDKVRQCILYDGTGPDARLVGIEYMITPDLFATLDSTEKKRWHTHTFEVKSGMLVMPGPTTAVAQQAWEAAETREMEKVVTLYGKIYNLWQVDRGHELPIGEPELMYSFTDEKQILEEEEEEEEGKKGGFEGVVGERDGRFGTDYRRKQEIRRGIEEVEMDDEADAIWKQK